MEQEKKEDEKLQNKSLSDMYDDFFYLISSLESEKKDLDKRNAVVPKMDLNDKLDSKIEIEKKEESKKEIKSTLEIDKTSKLTELYKKIDLAHLTNESKTVLKKMIEYAGKYNEGIVKNYIPFNMRIYCNNDKTLYSIVNIIIDGFTYFKYMKNNETVERSFFVVENSNNISELYDKQNSLVIFKDLSSLLNKDKFERDKLLTILESTIQDSSKIDGITTIVTDSTKQKIDEVFGNNTTLKNKIFDFELYTTDADSQEIYQSILSILTKDYIVTGEFEIKLLEYIDETYDKSPLSSPEYITTVVEKILFNKTKDVIDIETIPEFEKAKSNEELFKELNNLIGLDNVKTMLKDLVNLLEFKKKTSDSLKIKDTNLHMVFLGNPGTGKTTVARMIAGILYNLDYIDQNKLIEVSAKDLVGQYVGQTAPKTMEVIEKALGGVLFIDEAYSLATKPGSATTFNEECISTLIQAMENYRDNLVVIFAGYSKEMDAFLKSNSGIVSRIGYTMDFKDYTIDELIEIFKSMFNKSGFIIEEQAIEKARTIINEFSKTAGFGNARFVRNLYEKTIIKHATNTSSETSLEILKTISPNDISAENLSKLQ